MAVLMVCEGEPRAPELWMRAAGVAVTVVDSLDTDATPTIVGAPFKHQVLNHFPHFGRDEFVATVGATNLIHKERCYNTDVYGFDRAWEDMGFVPHDARVLVVGAGATGRAALAVLRSKVEKRWVWNRTAARGLKAQVDLVCSDISRYPLASITGWFDVVVNTTPLPLECSCGRVYGVGGGGAFDTAMARHCHTKAMSIVLGGDPADYLKKL